MKTIEEIKKEILENQSEMRSEGVKPRRYNSLSVRNEKLNEIIMYLETNPRDGFIVEEKERLERIIKNKNENYAYWSSNICPNHVDVKKRRSLFNRELGLTALRRQLKTLTYLLS